MALWVVESKARVGGRSTARVLMLGSSGYVPASLALVSWSRGSRDPGFSWQLQGAA